MINALHHLKTRILNQLAIIKGYFSKNPKFWALFAFAAFSIIYIDRTWVSTRSDFHAYYFAAEKALHGLSPYDLEDPTPYKYLPLTAYFFIPFTLLPYKFALVVFLLSLLCATFFIYREIESAFGWRGVALTAFCFIRFHNQDLANHQINSILLLLYLLYLKKRETDGLILGCVAFAVFASFKLMPIFLLWPLFWMRKWRELTLIGVFLVVLNFIPVVLFDRSGLIYHDWIQIISHTTERPAPSAANVQSIASMCWYWLGGFLSVRHFNILMFILGWVAAIAVLIAARKAKTHEDEKRVLSCMLAFSVLLSPLAWKHTYLQFIPLILIWIEERRDRRLFLFFSLTTVLPALIAIFSKEAADRSYLLVLTSAAFTWITLFEGQKGLQVTDREMNPI